MARSRKKSFAVTTFPIILSLLTFVGFGCYLLLYSGESNYIAETKDIEPDNVQSESGSVSGQISKGTWKLDVKVIYPAIVTDPASGTYPKYSSLLSVIEAWNPDNPDPPSVFEETLQHFNYSNPEDMAIALKYRNAEVPFKVYNVPEFDSLALKWTDEYLTSQFSKSIQGRRVEKSRNNHFMYWNGNVQNNIRFYEPPTEFIDNMQFDNWLRIAHHADKVKVQNESVHYYFMANAPPLDRSKSSFIARDIPSFSAEANNFFVFKVAANKGIQCRFGMRGIIAEAHYDSGRNMVAMIKGAKRYIINPPHECKKLGLITDQKHPSYRHSVIDWSDVSQATSRGFSSVDAIDTIVQTGEVLYIPSYWFHYIVSLKYSVQCNSRSGSPPNGEGQADIEECLGEKLKLKRYNRSTKKSKT